MKNFNAGMAGVVLCLLALAGCSSKPPGCADAEVAATAKAMVTKGLQNVSSDDPDLLMKGLLDRLRVEVFNVVDEGYRSDAKKQQCKGTVRISDDGKSLIELPVAYSTQKLVDSPDGFMLEISEGLSLTAVVTQHAQQVYRQRRWSGEWSGTYTCQGVDGATDGPGAPFSMPVTLVVDGDAVRLERTTRGGGVEKLAGAFSRAALGHGALQLSGEGMNSPDDKWRAEFEGEAHGREAVASGELRSMSGALLRRCELKVAQAAAKP